MSKMILNGRQYLNGTSKFYDCKGVFIDTDTVIESGTATHDVVITYTATEDCVLDFLLYTSGTSKAYVKINDKNIYTSSATTNRNYVFLAKGQTAEFSSYGDDGSYTAYRVQQGSAVSIQPVIYSDEEREIGVWMDGKPLYQKTIDVAPLPNITTKEIQLDSSIEKIISMDGYAIDSNDKWVIYFNDVVPANVSGSVRIFSNTNDKKLYINTRENLTSYNEAYVTIYYTKTTDIAGSGTYAQSGVPAVHYSTTEHVVGTWIDGKPVYEKVVKGTTITGGTTTNVLHGISNIDEIVSSSVMCHFSNNNAWRALNFTYNNGSTLDTWFSGYLIDSINISFQIGTSFATNVDKWRAIIRYTKTTD